MLSNSISTTVLKATCKTLQGTIQNDTSEIVILYPEKKTCTSTLCGIDINLNKGKKSLGSEILYNSL